MQKLVFLSQKELQRDLYRFEPADYGPFSWQLSKDVDLLVSSGFLAQRRKLTSEGGEKFDYSVTRSGKDLVEKILPDGQYRGIIPRFLAVVEKLKRENNRRNLRDLLRDVYSKYPEYAVNSRAKL